MILDFAPRREQEVFEIDFTNTTLIPIEHFIFILILRARMILIVAFGLEGNNEKQQWRD